MAEKYIDVTLGVPIVKVWEVSQEWMEGKSTDEGASAVLIDIIEADDLVKGCQLARSRYPNKNLRVSDGDFSVEMDAESGDVDVDALRQALQR